MSERAIITGCALADMAERRKLEAEIERLRGLLVDMGDKGSRLIEHCHHHVECATQCWSGEAPFPACDCGASGAVRAFENARAEFGEGGEE